MATKKKTKPKPKPIKISPEALVQLRQLHGVLQNANQSLQIYGQAVQAQCGAPKDWALNINKGQFEAPGE